MGFQRGRLLDSSAGGRDMMIWFRVEDRDMTVKDTECEPSAKLVCVTEEIKNHE
jgi:hypothetical protein